MAKQVASDAIAPEIVGERKAGEEATEETPVPVATVVDTDPRTAEITSEVRQKFQLTFSRGIHSATYEFNSEPSDAVKAEYQKQAEDTLDRLEAQRTQELQDRRKPKE
jgi:hypothetical protein